MSTSGSPAGTPDFAAPAETNTASDQTAASVSSDSLLTERRSGRSTLSWGLIRQQSDQTQPQQAMETPMHVDVLGVSNRSRAPKRTESRTTRSPYQSKSPKRSGNATGSRDAEDTLFSGHQMTAHERLEQLLSQNNMRVTERGERGRINEPNVVGSPSRRHVSPSIAIQMNSPPRELTRALPSEPQNIPITDVTSDENGRDAMGSVRSPYGRKAAMGHEISELTQKQLTAEVAIAEMANQRVEAEVRQSNLEHELSQEVHMFNIARSLITEMRTAFDIEDQGCIRRIEMLETQRNEYASGLVELGNKAEMVLHERNMEYNEEIRRLKYRSETYVVNRMKKSQV